MKKQLFISKLSQFSKHEFKLTPFTFKMRSDSFPNQVCVAYICVGLWKVPRKIRQNKDL